MARHTMQRVQLKNSKTLKKKHLDLVRAPGGKCVCAKRNLKKLAEKYGDGDIDWGERINVDFVYSKRVLWVYENISFIVGYC